MAEVKAELEDLAFKHLEPEEYRALIKKIQARRTERDQTIERLRVPLTERAAASRHHRLRGHRPPQAPLVDPQEDAAARQAVRGHLRPVGDPRVGRHGGRLLPRARRDPRSVDPAAGAHQGLHREPEVERLPVAAHDDLRPGAAALRDPDPHARDAPHGRVRHRGALAVQGRRESAPTSSTATSPGSGRCSSCSRTPTRRRSSSSSSSSTCYQDEIFVFTPHGRRDPAAQGRDADRLRLRGAHGGRASLQRRPGQRPDRAAAPRLKNGDTVEILTSRTPGPRGTGSRTYARGGRGTRSGSGSGRRSRPGVSALGREILDREIRRRRLPPADRIELLARPPRLSVRSADHVEAVLGRGDAGRGTGHARPQPGLAGGRLQAPKPTAFGRVIQRLRARARRPHPGRRRADGALRAVLPAGAGRPGGRLRHAGAGDFDPPQRLPQPAAPRQRARAPGRDRLAGDRR